MSEARRWATDKCASRRDDENESLAHRLEARAGECSENSQRAETNAHQIAALGRAVLGMGNVVRHPGLLVSLYDGEEDPKEHRPNSSYLEYVTGSPSEDDGTGRNWNVALWCDTRFPEDLDEPPNDWVAHVFASHLRTYEDAWRNEDTVEETVESVARAAERMSTAEHERAQRMAQDAAKFTVRAEAVREWLVELGPVAPSASAHRGGGPDLQSVERSTIEARPLNGYKAQEHVDALVDAYDKMSPFDRRRINIRLLGRKAELSEDQMSTVTRALGKQRGYKPDRTVDSLLRVLYEVVGRQVPKDGRDLSGG